MSLSSLQNQEGCLFMLNSKKYIYTGVAQENGKNIHTFYGLDGVNTSEKNTLNETKFDPQNISISNPDEALFQIVKSPIYGEYKTGVPEKLRSTPFSIDTPVTTKYPKDFWKIKKKENELTTLNGTPERITDMKKFKDENPNSRIPNYFSEYTYRIGEVGPSLQDIKDGKVTNIKEFIKKYKDIYLSTLKKS